MIKRLAASIVIYLFFFVPQVYAQHNEAIQRFDSRIVVNQDTSIEITEVIDYVTNQSKHGIIRYIPYRYKKFGFLSTNPISITQITDSQGTQIPFTTTKEEGNLVIKIGDPNKTFTGSQTYVISYTVNRAVVGNHDYDELYWDITGEGWQLPILHTTASIEVADAKIQDVICYSGAVGSDDHHCSSTFSDHQASLSYDTQVDYGDNVTVFLKLTQPNNLAIPGRLSTFINKLLDNLWFGVLWLPFACMIWFWLKHGRDSIFISDNVFDMNQDKPTKLKPLLSKPRTPLVYEPIVGLTPAEVGLMLDEKLDHQDFVAELLQLARLRFMKIEQTTASSFSFTKLKDADKTLTKHQSYLLEALFKTKNQVSLKELKGKFYTHIPKFNNLVFESVLNKRLFVEHPQKTQGKLGLVFFVSSLIASFLAWLQLADLVWYVFIFWIGYILVFIILIRVVAQKTAVGSNYALQASGLQRTIRLGSWREKIKEKHLFIDEILPLAITLGVIDQLTRDMKALNIKPPDYYSVSAGLIASPAQSLADFTKTSASTMSYNPSSSSYSSGSGGGGSSGGGGGGGGGSSW